MSKDQNFDELTSEYIETRDYIATAKKALDERLAGKVERMRAIENIFDEFFNTTGAKNVTTEHGTAYRKKYVQATVLDMDAVLEFISERDLWHFLPKQVNKKAVAEFLEETGDTIPGVKYTSRYKVTVNRA